MALLFVVSCIHQVCFRSAGESDPVLKGADTIMSRMYNQTGNLYSGVLDCIRKTVKKEGILAVYKGFNAHLGSYGILFFLHRIRLESPAAMAQ